MPNPTIKDVARLARVSTATVSNVINGTSFVSAPLKARVHEAVAQLGFAPSRVAQGLRMQSTRLIGVVVADITNPFFSELVRRIGSIADSLGYNVLALRSRSRPGKGAVGASSPGVASGGGRHPGADRSAVDVFRTANFKLSPPDRHGRPRDPRVALRRRVHRQPSSGFGRDAPHLVARSRPRRRGRRMAPPFQHNGTS